MLDAAAKISGGDEFWVNDQYVVNVRRQQPEGMPELVHISIRNKDRSARHDWRDFQRIKNDIVGPEEEAFELYPAESRLVDTSNQYHIWCFVGVRFESVGYKERLVSQDGDEIGAVQRRWPDSDAPPDLRYISHQDIVDAANQKGEPEDASLSRNHGK